LVRTYEIRCSKRADDADVERLDRAFGRVRARHRGAAGSVVVGVEDGSYRIAMEMLADERFCERLFAEAWYDAFGPRGATHVGRVLEGAGDHHLAA